MDNRPTTSLVAALIGLSLLGLAALQLFLIRRAAILEAQLYARTVNSAMQRVVSRLETQETLHYVRGLPLSTRMTRTAAFHASDTDTDKEESEQHINIAVSVESETPKVDFKNDKVVFVLRKPEHVIIRSEERRGGKECRSRW